MLQKSLGEIVHMPQPELTATVQEDAYRAKVLKTFIKHGRLTQIPAQLKKQIIILEKLVEAFEPDYAYTEKEVNLILLDFHEDFATLRRGLINHKLMRRDKGIYHRN